MHLHKCMKHLRKKNTKIDINYFMKLNTTKYKANKQHRSSFDVVVDMVHTATRKIYLHNTLNCVLCDFFVSLNNYQLPFQ